MLEEEGKRQRSEGEIPCIYNLSINILEPDIAA